MCKGKVFSARIKSFEIFKQAFSRDAAPADQFFEKLAEASVIYRLAVRGYLREGASEEFKERLDTVGELETQADSLRRDIEQKLYHVFSAIHAGSLYILMLNYPRVTVR